MYYQYDQSVLKKLQTVQKDILHDIQRLCEKYNINYFAIGGTLIGAVRHNGFIPWDDDIDLGMLREDFDKFLAIPEEEYSDKYYLCAPETDNEYYSIIPKFVLKNSAYVTQLAVETGVKEMGIFVEIFVFENVSADKKQRKRQITRVNWVKNLHTQAVSPNIIVYDKGWLGVAKWIVKKFVSLQIRIFHISDKQTNAKFLKLTNSLEKTGYVAYFGDGTTEDFLTLQEDLFPLKKCEFEDGQIMIPHNYDKLLHQAYGDYMTLPPENQRWNQAPMKLRFPNEEYIILHDGKM